MVDRRLTSASTLSHTHRSQRGRHRRPTGGGYPSWAATRAPKARRVADVLPAPTCRPSKPVGADNFAADPDAVSRVWKKLRRAPTLHPARSKQLEDPRQA
jgi:hypothetical protein